MSSRGGTEEAKAQGAAFEAAFSKLLTRVQAEPSSYGQLCLAGIFETREEYLRAFEFPDAYRSDKASENASALAVLPDLLRELSELPMRERLQSIIEGVLAGNIFDWRVDEIYFSLLFLSGDVLARNWCPEPPPGAACAFCACVFGVSGVRRLI